MKESINEDEFLLEVWEMMSDTARASMFNYKDAFLQQISKNLTLLKKEPQVNMFIEDVLRTPIFSPVILINPKDEHFIMKDMS